MEQISSVTTNTQPSRRTSNNSTVKAVPKPPKFSASHARSVVLCGEMAKAPESCKWVALAWVSLKNQRSTTKRAFVGHTVNHAF